MLETGFCRHSCLFTGRENSCCLHVCVPTSMCDRNVERKQVLWAKKKKKEGKIALTPSSTRCLVYEASCTFLTSLPPPRQMLPSSTSSTAKPRRTLRSCARLAPTRSPLAERRLRPPLRRPLPPGGPSLRCRPPSTTRPPTPCPTRAPSPACRACLCHSPPGARTDQSPHASPCPSDSRPRCGGSCRGSGTAASWRSSARTRDGCRRYTVTHDGKQRP